MNQPQDITTDSTCQRDLKLTFWLISATGLLLLLGSTVIFSLDLYYLFAPYERITLSLFFGAIVGFTLGLTGGGGSIFAVPLLIYGLNVDPREAIGISLAAVATIALLGAIQRLRAREIEVGIGILFALGGMLGAPLGSWLGRQLPASLLLLLFSGLMAFIAVRMWLRAVKKPEETRIVRASLEKSPAPKAPACRYDPTGKMKLTAPCMGAMTIVGSLTGIISGLFGVGGGFVIVPALIFFSTIDMHRAVATSLLAIALISGSGVAANVASGQSLALDITGLFIVGGGIGMGLGMVLSKRISGPQLQKIFATAIVVVALFIAAKNLL